MENLDSLISDLVAEDIATVERLGYGRPDEGVLQKRTDDLRSKAQQILVNGLDIGTIIRCVVPVTLAKNEEHGWVFVKSNGAMYRVRDSLR